MEFLCILDCFLNNAVCVSVGDFNSPFFTTSGMDSKAASFRNFTDFTNLNQYNGIANNNNNKTIINLLLICNRSTLKLVKKKSYIIV